MSTQKPSSRWVGLIRWLPARLREQFGAEIEEVFAARLEDAAGRGWLALIGVLLRELIQLPPIHFRSLWLRRRLELPMTEDNSSSPNRMPEARPTWLSAAAWALPFLLFGAGLTIFELTPAWAPWISLPPPFSTGVVALLAALGLTLVALAFTMNKTASPGWFSSLGLALACAWYLADLSVGGKPVGSWSWWGFLAAALVIAARGRSLRALWLPFQAAWRDWTRLSFLLYGGLVFLLLTVSLDSVKGLEAIPALMVPALIFALGAALAQRVITPLRRVLILDGPLALIILAIMLAEAFTRPDLVSARFALGQVMLFSIWLAVPFFPGLLGLLRLGLRRNASTES